MTRPLLRATLLLAAFALVAFGCGDSGGDQFVCEGELVGNTCVPADDSGDTPADDQTGDTPADDEAGDTPVDDTTADDTTDETTDDTTADDPGDCDEAVAGTKPIGAGCTQHCECDTGYCYDEDYLGEFRFCTRDCAGSCNEEAGVEKYKCLNLNNSAFSDFDLTMTWICAPVCDSVDDCLELSSEYTACGYGFGTQWLGATIAASATCVIAEEME